MGMQSMSSNEESAASDDALIPFDDMSFTDDHSTSSESSYCMSEDTSIDCQSVVHQRFLCAERFHKLAEGNMLRADFHSATTVSTLQELPQVG